MASDWQKSHRSAHSRNFTIEMKGGKALMSAMRTATKCVADGFVVDGRESNGIGDDQDQILWRIRFRQMR
jgi:hypothetical protein